MANKVQAMAAKVREKMENVAGKISEKGGFGSPFAKGTGAALRNDNDYRIRKKRSSLDFQIKEDALIGEEFLLALPPKQEHVHRGKRSPCNQGGGGAGGLGDGTGAGIDDGDYTDLAERRRRAIARKRAAARKRAEQNKNSRKSSNKRKKLVNDDDKNEDTANEVLTRRKRQSEIDDLNPNMTKTGNDLKQQAQQAAENIRIIWENFMNSMNEMAQRMKQYIIGQNSTDVEQI